MSEEKRYKQYFLTVRDKIGPSSDCAGTERVTNSLVCEDGNEFKKTDKPRFIVINSRRKLSRQPGDLDFIAPLRQPTEFEVSADGRYLHFVLPPQEEDFIKRLEDNGCFLRVVLYRPSVPYRFVRLSVNHFPIVYRLGD